MYAKEPPPLYMLRVTAALVERPNIAEDLECRLLSTEYISEACRSLLQLSDPYPAMSVDPIHFSFLEYLQDLPLDKLQSEFWKPLTDSHRTECILACRCMDLLSIALPEDPNDLNRTMELWPSLDYPASFFDRHATCATKGSVEPHPDLLASLNRILDASSKKLVTLVNL